MINPVGIDLGGKDYTSEVVIQSKEQYAKDQALKREIVEALKEIFSKAHPGVYDGSDADRFMGCCYVCDQEPKIRALIARMEAAERICNRIPPSLISLFDENYDAWLKSKGETV